MQKAMLAIAVLSCIAQPAAAASCSDTKAAETVNGEGVSMTWSRAFPEPFVLADGRKIKTRYEAGQFVLALPGRHRANGHWQGWTARRGSSRSLYMRRA